MRRRIEPAPTTTPSPTAPAVGAEQDPEVGAGVLGAPLVEHDLAGEATPDGLDHEVDLLDGLLAEVVAGLNFDHVQRLAAWILQAMLGAHRNVR